MMVAAVMTCRCGRCGAVADAHGGERYGQFQLPSKWLLVDVGPARFALCVVCAGEWRELEAELQAAATVARVEFIRAKNDQ